MGLDDGGKEKAAIVARIVGAKSNGESAPRANGDRTTRVKAAGAKANGRAPDPIEVPAGGGLQVVSVWIEPRRPRVSWFAWRQ